jgi:hypothetical protein
MQTMSLSFSVSPVRSENALLQACSVRAESYGHHVPALRNAYAEPDPLDEGGACTSYIATDKASGQPVGTLRVQVGAPGLPLTLEGSYSLPATIAATTRAELTRMSVSPGADPLVRLVLWKTGYYFCLANQVQYMVIGARRPALIRQYRSLGFEQITDAPVPFTHAGGFMHSVLQFDVRSAERRWFETHHPLYEFMVDTHHPDMSVFGTAWRPGQRSRRADIDAETTANVVAALALSEARSSALQDVPVQASVDQAVGLFAGASTPTQRLITA